MRRPSVLAFFVAGVPLLVLGQGVAAQHPAHRIGFISGGSPAGMATRVQAFRDGLRELGLVEGETIVIDFRWADGKDERLPGLARDLVREQVRVIVTHGVQATLAAGAASRTIPVLCFTCGDLLSTGVVTSLNRPGGNITGLTSIHPETSGKRLELLKEMLPGVRRVAVLHRPGNPVTEPEMKATRDAMEKLALLPLPAEVGDPSEMAAAFSAMTRDGAEAVVIISDAALHGRIAQIAALAKAHRLPAIAPWGAEFVRVGGLVGFGPDGLAIAQRAAGYLDRILKGAHPGDLPVEQPTKFELVLNLATARELGIEVPRSLLARADELVE